MSIKTIIKSIIKNILYRPSLSKMGNNSYVFLPRKIINGNFISIGNNSIVRANSVFQAIDRYEKQSFTPSISIGDDVYIGGFCQIHCMDRIQISNGSVISEHVYISDISHGMDPELGRIMQQDLISKGPVIIGEDTFIGYGVSILPGVTLGKRCIVGTRSVVNKSFPDYSVIAGAPAKLIKYYDVITKQWVKA